MKNRERKLTFEQEIVLRTFYEKRNALRRKRLNKFINNFYKGFSSIMPTLIIIAKVLSIAFICSLVGSGSQPVIYHFNKPLGAGYAYYVSYVIAGLIGAVLYQFMFRDKEVK